MPLFSSNEVRWLYENFSSHVKTHAQNAEQDKLRLLVLHISEGCNLGCTYCFADKGQYGSPTKKFMTPELAVDSVKTAIGKYGQLERIKFFGGEPFLNMAALEAVQDFIESQKNRNEGNFHPPRLTMVSNMTIASERAIAWIKRANPIITGSIDGPEELHNKFRIFPKGEGSFSVVDSNIKKLLQECNQPSALECVYSPHHYRAGLSIADVHAWIEERYGVHEVLVHPMGLIGDSVLQISNYEWRKYSAALPELSVDYGEFLTSRKKNKKHPAKSFLEDVFWKNQTDAHCDLGVNNITVNASGRIYPCYTLLPDTEQDMGGINEMKDGKDFLRIQRNFINQKKESIHECSICDIKTTCHSCPGEMKTLEGSMDKPSLNSCNFMVGIVEGSLLSINKLRSNETEWMSFQSEFQRLHLNH